MSDRFTKYLLFSEMSTPAQSCKPSNHLLFFFFFLDVQYIKNLLPFEKEISFGAKVE